VKFFQFITIFSLLLHLQNSALLQAKLGKVFFSDGRWMKGDIQTQKDEDGKEVVVISVDSGSITVKKSEIKRIIYTGTDSSSNQSFHHALNHTVSKSVPSKPLTPYDPYIQNASEKHQMDPDLIKAVIKQESNFNSRDVSNKGAQGLMQLMPETAEGLGVQNVFDPYENIHAGTRFLRILLEDFNGDLEKALAAYNAGPSVVKKYGKIPPYKETQEYVRNVLNYYGIYRGNKAFAFKDKRGRLIFTDQPYLP
jgi:hypothetical protein